ncbi:MAG: DUF1648 domain-containing protein [bacterium]|nr:DUF1648 domain-containing protein [bacterium]
MNVRVAWGIFAATLLIAVIHIAWSGTVLPERVASHFGVSGQADGWSTPSGFMAVYVVTIALMALVFGGPSVFFPRLPDSAFSIPRREYWMAPERRAATLARFTGQFLVFGAATNVFLVAIMHIVVRANLAAASAPDAGEPRLSTAFFVAFGLYMCATLGWSGWIIVYHMRAPRSDRKA